MARELTKINWDHGLPEPIALQRQLQNQLEALIGDARRDRVIHRPEDTWPLVRSLTAAQEVLKGYAGAFSAVAKVAVAEVEEELLEAVKEQNGIPLSGMTVPDAEGDIKISLDTPNVWAIDVDALVTAVAIEIGGEPDDDNGAGIRIATEAIMRFLTLGKFEPQISKVNAFAKELAREGEDQLASTVNSAVTKTVPYKGVKVARDTGRK